MRAAKAMLLGALLVPMLHEDAILSENAIARHADMLTIRLIATDSAGNFATSQCHLLLADPRELKTGLNPISGIYYNQIAGSAYGNLGMEDAETQDRGPDTKEIEVMQPSFGVYALLVIGKSKERYSLDIRGLNQDGTLTSKAVNGVLIAAGEIHAYKIAYTKDYGIHISRDRPMPSAINKNLLLAFKKPLTNQSMQPAGTRQYTISLCYGSAIIPATFRAVLNGNDVTHLFHPALQCSEMVTIPLQPGINSLLLSIGANLGKEVLGNIHNFAFIVQ